MVRNGNWLKTFLFTFRCNPELQCWVFLMDLHRLRTKNDNNLVCRWHEYLHESRYKMADSDKMVRKWKMVTLRKDLRFGWNLELQRWVFLLYLDRKWTIKLKISLKQVRRSILAEISSLKGRFLWKHAFSQLHSSAFSTF